jgi:hypothetical protein
MAILDAPRSVLIQLFIEEGRGGSGQYGLVVKADNESRPIGRQNFTSPEEVFERFARGFAEVAGMGFDGSNW